MGKGGGGGRRVGKRAEEGGRWGKGGGREGESGERGRRGESGERGRRRGQSGERGRTRGKSGERGRRRGSRVGEQRGFGGGGRALVNNRKRVITKRFETFNSFHFNTLNSLKDLLIPYKLALDESSFTSSPFDARKEPDVTRQFLIDSFSVKFFSCLTDQKQVRTLNAFQVCPHVLIG